jgi:succinate-semialdehyde dehydrogenase/glutarate-semialdehyde dehydrogenase
MTITADAAARLDDPALFRNAAYVNGRWVSRGSSGTFTVSDPSTGSVIAELPLLSGAEVAAAISAADRALPAWRALPGKERSRVLHRWFDLVTEHGGDLARIIVAEEGKPLAEARAEVAYAASFIEWFAEEAKRVRGEIFGSPRASGRIVVLNEPTSPAATRCTAAAPNPVPGRPRPGLRPVQGDDIGDPPEGIPGLGGRCQRCISPMMIIVFVEAMVPDFLISFRNL